MLRAACFALFCLLAGCAAAQPAAAPPLPPAAAAPSATPRLWYVGLALYDETWSEGDVTATADALARAVQGYRVVPVVLSNRGDRFPPAADATIAALLQEVARRAGPQDIVLLYTSTHGAPGLLGRSAEGEERDPISADMLRGWLAPLGARPTVIVLSACFSGSFIPALKADNRLIFTAARADRTSFGCQAGAEHTVFGAALLDALSRPRSSWRAIVARAREDVTAAERKLGVGAPSEPQLAVGRGVSALFDQPLF